MEEFENSITSDESDSAPVSGPVFRPELNIYTPELRTYRTDYRNKIREEEPVLPRPAVLLTVCTLLLTVAFSLYCIIARTYSLKEGFYSPETKTTVILGLNSRPADAILTDDAGRYTSEGIWENVGPSVVEILIYDSKISPNPRGTGSGIILSEDGYIVTNAHVIAESDTVRVVLSDKTVFDASVIGHDSKSDIAVIKIIPGEKEIRPAEFGNSDEIIHGEQVMAIGNPEGLRSSISGGFVSGINREIRPDQTGFKMNYIQTDAAVSPGNSGGALVNMYGQVIGIVTFKYVSTSNEGLGFAIPVNDAKPVIEELIANGYISGRFRVGITFYEITEEQAAETGLPRGLLIDSLDESCDISTSGVKPHDIITEVEGSRVTDYDTFMEAIHKHNKGAGDRVHAKAVRVDEDDESKRETIKFEFTLVEDTSGDF